MKLRFKDANGKNYPDWEGKKLGEVIAIKRGSSPRPIQKYINQGMNKWLKITDVNSRKVGDIERSINDDGAS